MTFSDGSELNFTILDIRELKWRVEGLRVKFAYLDLHLVNDDS